MSTRRRRSLQLGVVSVALAFATAVLGTASATSSSRGCEIRGYRTVVAGSPVTVIRQRGGVSVYRTHLACYGRRGRPLVLGDEFSEESLERVRVNGRFVAVVLSACSRNDDSCETIVQVSDVRQRRRTTYGVEGVRDLLLTARGAVVAIVPFRGALAVVTADSGRLDRVAQGGDIEVGSLAVAGPRVYWLQGGRPRTAAFGIR